MVAAAEVRHQGFHAAAHVAYAHRAGVGLTVYLVEGLHLERAHERHERVGKRVERPRNESHDEQQQYFLDEDYLPPVYFLLSAVVYVNQLGHRYPQQERQHGHEVFDYRLPVAAKQRRGHKNDVAGLGVGENSAAAAIGVGVLESSGKNYEHRRPEFIRHLPMEAISAHN